MFSTGEASRGLVRPMVASLASRSSQQVACDAVIDFRVFDMAAFAKVAPAVAAIVTSLLAFIRLAVAANTGSPLKWSDGRLMWTLVVCTAVFSELGVVVLQVQRPSPVWQKCSVALQLSILSLLVASYHPGISTQDSPACQFLAPMWLIGSIAALPVVLLQSPKTGLASLGSFAVGGFALSGLALWLRPFFATSTKAEIVDAVMLLAFFSLVPTVALAQFARSFYEVAGSTREEGQLSQVIGHRCRSPSSEQPPRFHDPLITGLQYLARHHFRILVCLDRDGVILSTNAEERAEELGLSQGELFPSLFITADKDLMEQLLDEVGWAAEGAYATEKGRIASTGRVLQIEAVCVGGEFSGRSDDFHVLLGVGEVEEDGRQSSNSVQAPNSHGERTGGRAQRRSKELLRDHWPSRALPGMCPEVVEAAHPLRTPRTHDEDAQSSRDRSSAPPLSTPRLSGHSTTRRARFPGRINVSDDLVRDYGAILTELAQTDCLGAARSANVEQGGSPVVQTRGAGVETSPFFPKERVEEESA